MLLQQYQNSTETHQTTHKSMLHAVGLACGRLGACAGQKSMKYNVFAENPWISTGNLSQDIGSSHGKSELRTVRTHSKRHRTDSESIYLSIPYPILSFPGSDLAQIQCLSPSRRPAGTDPPTPLSVHLLASLRFALRR